MVLRRVLLIVLPLLLISCGGSESEPAAATSAVQEQATATPAPTETAQPTETATAAASQESPTASPTEVPTAVPAEATAPPEPPEDQPQQEDDGPAEPEAAMSGGRGSFEDNFATADRFVLALTGLEMPPTGEMLVGWLTADDGSFANIGVVKMEADGSAAIAWNSPGSENLISRYSGFQMTLETDGSGVAPAGPVVMAGGFDDGAAALRLFVRNDGQPATPLNTALAIGMRSQGDIALQHIQNASNASAIGAQAEMRAHLEHVINILEGSAGSRFGDHDGNGAAENPGDGFGTAGYIRQIAAMFPEQPEVAQAAQAALDQIVAVEDEVLLMLDGGDSAQMSGMLTVLQTLGGQLQNEQLPRLYQAAQQAVSFAISPLE